MNQSQYSIELLKIKNKYLYSKIYEYYFLKISHFVVFVLKYIRMIIFWNCLQTKKALSPQKRPNAISKKYKHLLKNYIVDR